MNEQNIKPDIGKLCAQWWADNLIKSDEASDQIDDMAIYMFKHLLSDDINIAVAEQGSIMLGTDYYPEPGILANAAFNSNISGKAFPQKTFMTISRSHVSVSRDFGKMQILYSESNKQKTKQISDNKKVQQTSEN